MAPQQRSAGGSFDGLSFVPMRGRALLRLPSATVAAAAATATATARCQCPSTAKIHTTAPVQFEPASPLVLRLALPIVDLHTDTDTDTDARLLPSQHQHRRQTRAVNSPSGPPVLQSAPCLASASGRRIQWHPPLEPDTRLD